MGPATASPLVASTLVSEKTTGPENGIATGGVDPGILYVHTTMRSMRMAWDSPPRFNQSCHPLMRRVHVGPSVIIVYTIVVIFQFLLATKIVPGKEAGSKEARKRK